jgi:hypothetical protein
MDVEKTIKETFGPAARCLTDRTYGEVRRLCRMYSIFPETWCRWWVETHPPGMLYDNMAASAGNEESLGIWVQQQKEHIYVLTGLEIEAFNVEAARATDPITLLRSDIPDVSVLICYVMGRYLGYPQEVARLEAAACRQLRELPWYREPLEKMSKYLPEVHYGPET